MSTSRRSTSWAGWWRRSSAATRNGRSPTRFELQREYDSGERKLVGVNSYTEGDDGEIEIWRVDPALERKQIDRVQGVRARRDAAAVEAQLAELKTAAAQDDHNLMPNLLECARVHASEGEIVEALQSVFGTYTESPVF
jgi:methylmalonyl-CoA mutase, N-terminal domain